jgi:GINS complex subunit 1
MYGETANKLVQNAKRIQSLPHLPPYASDLSRTIVREVRDLDRDVSSILAPYGSSFNPSAEPSTACALLVNHLCMRRNKRCLLAYHKVRAEKLEGYCWEGVDVLEQSGSGKEGDGGMSGKKEESSLSPEEEEYVRQYSDLLAAYKGQWTDIDLTGSLEPPRDLFIDVRVLKDAGEIQTEYGYASHSLGLERKMPYTDNMQIYHFDQEQPILCSPWRCRTFDCARVPSAPQLTAWRNR